ncbi:hypothetical protein OAG68_02360 [bacterium]|nr:hypothetical protein [bacterium]
METVTENICASCSSVLASGKDQFFEIKIEAVADRGSPDLDDVANEFTGLEEAYLNSIEQLDGASAQEAMDQIATTRVFYLCTPCYQKWIEDPAGGGR